MTSLTIIAPNARRCVVKVVPSQTIAEVLDESCKKLGFDTDKYILKHRDKLIDASLSFRLSGLPNNATLQLIETTNDGGDSIVSSQVDVALQLSDGSRKLQSFMNDVSLCDMLMAFGTDLVTNTPTGTVPSCSYMNRTFIGEKELQSTTLKSIGIYSGRIVIRYAAIVVSADQLADINQRLAAEQLRKTQLDTVYAKRKAENDDRIRVEKERAEQYERESKEQNLCIDSKSVEMQQSLPPPPPPTAASRLAYLESLYDKIDQSLQPSNSNSDIDMLSIEELIQLRQSLRQQPASITAEPVQCFTNPVSEFANFKFPETSTRVEDNRTKLHASGQAITDTSCDRNAILYKRDESDTATCDEIDDDQFFEINTQDVKKMHSLLSEEIKYQSQRAFVPQSFVDNRNKELKAAAYKHTVVRFILPNQYILQGCFLSIEPTSHLYDFITSVVSDAKVNFVLAVPPNETVVNDKRTLLDTGLSPSVSLVVKLKSPIAANACDSIMTKVKIGSFIDANAISTQWLISTNTKFIPYQPKIDSTTTNSGATGNSSSNEENSGNTRRAQAQSSKMPKWFR